MNMTVLRANLAVVDAAYYTADKYRVPFGSAAAGSVIVKKYSQSLLKSAFYAEDR